MGYQIKIDLLNPSWPVTVPVVVVVVVMDEGEEEGEEEEGEISMVILHHSEMLVANDE